jgi:ABC-type branched-subunit amino acid transport system permease subunit
LLTLLFQAHWRWVVLSVTIYLFAFAWETRLAAEPAATRILIVGATLVVLMIVHPQGLLGQKEVKIV